MNTDRFGLPQTTRDKITGVLAQYPDIEQVVVYGSRAMGSSRRGSDIDLCLKGEQLDWKTLNRIADRLDALELPYRLDLCLYHLIDNPDLIAHIDRVGQPFN